LALKLLSPVDDAESRYNSHVLARKGRGLRCLMILHSVFECESQTVATGSVWGVMNTKMHTNAHTATIYEAANRRKKEGCLLLKPQVLSELVCAVQTTDPELTASLGGSIT
jgi:hypothetical protein